MHKEKEKVSKMLSEYDLDVDWVPVEERLEEPQLLEIIDKYNGIICGDDRITKAVIEKAENLKTIVKWGTGIDSIESEYAISKGIPVHRTPNAFTEPVADTTLAMMLSHVRTLFKNDNVIKTGGWEKPQGYTLAEKTVGLIGFGDIGRGVAKRLKGFGCKVLVNDLKEIPDNIQSELNVKSVSKEEIYSECDIISLHCDLNETSEFLINKDSLNHMKRTPFLINTARGPLVKEQDLIDALEKGQICGAGLDVFENEPLPAESPLRKMEQVVASCHNSNSSPLKWDAVHKNSIKNLVNELLND